MARPGWEGERCQRRVSPPGHPGEHRRGRRAGRCPPPTGCEIETVEESVPATAARACLETSTGVALAAEPLTRDNDGRSEFPLRSRSVDGFTGRRHTSGAIVSSSFSAVPLPPFFPALVDIEASTKSDAEDERGAHDGHSARATGPGCTPGASHRGSACPPRQEPRRSTPSAFCAPREDG